MKIISVNSGSSSVKMQVFEMPSEKLLIKIGFEKVGFKDSFAVIKTNNEKEKILLSDYYTHSMCISKTMEILKNKKIISSIDDISGVAHRVVMGADKFETSVIINESVEKTIKSLFDMAPLHNPANYSGIQAFKESKKDIKQVASFDTAYHQTMPLENYVFPISYEYYEKHKIRRFGAHGISVNFVTKEYAKIKNKKMEDVNIIVCHIGAGASITSIVNGKSFDTSMGLTPLGGIMMGTRSGDIDPSVILELMKINDFDVEKVSEILNKKSGLLGVSELSNDMRDILANKEINAKAKLAYQIFINRIVEIVASYAIKYKKLDGIVLCAGVGENESEIQKELSKYFNNLGILSHNSKQERVNGVEFLSTHNSPIDLLVIETNEELMMARDAYNLLK